MANVIKLQTRQNSIIHLGKVYTAFGTYGLFMKRLNDYVAAIWMIGGTALIAATKIIL